MTIRAGWGPNPKTPIGMPPRLLPLTQQLKAFSSVTNEASSGKFGFPRIKETSFETQWRNLTEAQRDQLEKEYADVGKMDWRKLTFEQMRACTRKLISLFSISN